MNRFTIDKIEEQHSYLISMNVTVCTESQESCEQNYVVLDDVMLPILQCQWQQGFNVASKSVVG